MKKGREWKRKDAPYGKILINKKGELFLRTKTLDSGGIGVQASGFCYLTHELTSFAGCNFIDKHNTSSENDAVWEALPDDSD